MDRLAFEKSFQDTIGPVYEWLSKVDPLMGRIFHEKVEEIRGREAEWF